MSKKVLFLHGYGESALLAGMSTKDLKDVCKNKGYNFLDVPDGFTPLKSATEVDPIHDEEYRKMVASGDLDAFSWYPLAKGSEGGHRKAGFDDFGFRSKKADTDVCVKKLADMITKLGGVDIICGFSQGGELAYLLMEYLATPAASAYAWASQCKVVCTFGSEDSFLQRGSAPSAIKKDTSFFICYGQKDLDSVHDSQTTKAALEKAGARSVVTHEVVGLDHHMPKNEGNGKAAYEAMDALIKAADKPAGAAAPATAVDISERHDDSKIARLPDGRSVRAIDDLMNDPNTKMFTWEIPPEAPPGWGKGNGEAYLIEHCGLYRPDHPKWIEMHPEGVEAYWAQKDKKR